MKKSRYLTYFIALIGAVTHLEGAYVIKNGKLLDADAVATLPAEEHYKLGVEAMNRKDWKEASIQFRILSLNFVDTVVGQDAHYYYGVVEYFLEEYDSANEAFTEYLKGQNNPQFFDETMQYKYAIACELKNGARTRLFGSRRCPKWAFGEELAIEIYDEIIVALPCHELAALSLYFKGELLREQRFYRDSIDVYLQLIRRFPKHELAPQSYLAITSTYLEQGEREFQNPDLIALAEIILRRFKDDFPRSELIGRAEANVMAMKEVYAQGLYDIGQMYEKKKETRASIIYYQNAITKFPETAVSSLCQERLSVLSTYLLE